MIFLENKAKKIFFILLAIWFILNTIQAFLTELTGDEAYYATFSQHLDWGYFDHPPMVALFTYFGTLLFDGELGVRFLNVLFSTLNLIILGSFLTLNKKSVILFFAFAFSLTMFSIYGFLTAPDVSLLFFASLFIWSIKQYLEQPNWKHVPLLAFSMAAMLYSKYHGIIFIALLVIANPKLLRRPSFYAASILGALFFSPHLWWQYQHDFPSLIYHLSGHSANNWQWKFIFEYPLYQILVLSPFIAIPILNAMYKFKVTNDFERTLLYLFWGTLFFFFLMTLKSHVEPHWTTLIALPALILVPQYYVNHPRRKTILRLAFINIVLLLFARLIIALPNIQEPHFHTSTAWANIIAKKSKTHPVVFYGSYQYASLLEFYTDIEANSYNPYYYHQTQFDMWQKENNLRHKKVLFMSKEKIKAHSDSLETPKGLFYTYWINDYYSLQGLKISISEKETKFAPNGKLILASTFFNPYNFDVDLQSQKYPLSFMFLAIDNQGNEITGKPILLNEISTINPFSTKKIRWELPILKKGKYTIVLIPASNKHPFGMGSNNIIINYK